MYKPKEVPNLSYEKRKELLKKLRLAKRKKIHSRKGKEKAGR